MRILKFIVGIIFVNIVEALFETVSSLEEYPNAPSKRHGCAGRIPESHIDYV
jgi:hypothetical protein